jgi:hypothetical protein
VACPFEPPERGDGRILTRMARVAAASLDIRPRPHLRTRARTVDDAYGSSHFPELVREAGFDPAISCFQGRRITKLSHSLFGGARGETRTPIPPDS